MPFDLNPDKSTDRLLKQALRGATRPGGDQCVDAETFAAWAEGALADAEIARFDSHVATCERCRAMLAAFANTETAGAAEARTVVPFRPRSPLRWLVPVIAGTAAASLLIWTVARNREDNATPVTSLAKSEPAAGTGAPVDRLAAASPTPAPNLASPAPAPPLTARNEEATGRGTAVFRKASEPVARSRAEAPPQPAAAPPPPPPALPTGAASTAIPTQPPATLPKPPPPVTVDAVNQLRADRNALGFLVNLPGVVEFGPPEKPVTTTATSGVAGGMAGRTGAAGGGGGRGGGATAAGAGARTMSERVQGAMQQVRWRVLQTGQVAKSLTGGATWEAITVDAKTIITNGASPSTLVCWLIGKAGAVFKSTDGVKFQRLTSPSPVDLRTITAVDDLNATVTTIDGKTYTTTDGGFTWKES